LRGEERKGITIASRSRWSCWRCK